MKRMKKLSKIIALLLAFVLIGAACSGGDKAPAEEETSQELAAGETSQEVTEEVLGTDKFEAIDMGGRTIRVAAWWPVVPNSFDEEPDPAEDTPEEIAKYENLKRVEEKYNVVIEYINVPWGELLTQLTTSVMAGAPYADIVFLPPNFAIPAVINDLVLPISEFSNPDADVNTDQVAVQSAGYMIDGEYMVRPVGTIVNSSFLCYNKELMEGLGLKDPQELYLEDPDAWNWDTFLEYAKTGTQDTDGDGNVDQYGLSGWVNLYVNNFVASNGGAIYQDYENEQGIDSPETMEALEFINQIHNVDQVVNDSADLYDWAANTWAYTEGNNLFFSSYAWYFTENKPTFDYGIVPFPKGPSNDGDVTFAISYDGFMIPSGVDQPNEVYQVLEELLWFFGEDPYLRDDSVEEWLQAVWLTQEDIDLYFEINDNQGPIELQEYIPNYPFGNVVGGIINEQKTVAQLVEENKQIAQDAIDVMLNPDLVIEKEVERNEAHVKPGTPEIDGVIDDIWADAEVIEATQYIQNSVGATALVQTMYDDDNLYVLAVVTDDNLQSGNANPWEQDSVEFFVDEDAERSSTYASGDFQYRVNYENVQSGPACVSAVTITETGYILEVALPLTLGSKAPGDIMGFEVQVNDDQGSGTRDSYATWFDTTGESWNNTSMFGTLIFD
jgi:multiple sugar transport system substrate-binding protein